ncbi:hypothetical protein D3C86_2045340 [compost metagenome]
MTNVLGCGGLIVGHHPKARGQCFQYDIAEGFGQAREHENVPGCIVAGQDFTAL